MSNPNCDTCDGCGYVMDMSLGEALKGQIPCPRCNVKECTVCQGTGKAWRGGGHGYVPCPLCTTEGAPNDVES